MDVSDNCDGVIDHDEIGLGLYLKQMLLKMCMA